MHELRRLVRFLGPYRAWALAAPALMAGEVALDLMQPRLVERIVDMGIARGDMGVVLHTGLLMVALAFLGMVGGVGCSVCSVFAAVGMGADLRRALFARIQALSFGNLDRLETGGLITRLTNDVAQVQDMTMMMLRIMVRAPLLLVGSLVMGILTSPRLSLLYTVLIPLVIAILVGVIRKTYPMFAAIQERLDQLNTVLQENLAGMRVVKAFARSTHEKGRFGSANDSLMDRAIATARVSAITMPLIIIALNAGIVGVLWLGGANVIRGGFQVGQIIAFINYLMQTLMALMFVSMMIMRIARAEASAARIREVLVSEPEIAPAKTTLQPADAVRGRVAFEEVTFSYSTDGGDPVLAGITFTAEPGETVAILGATGAGKSTLVNLIPRFYDATQGRVLIDDVDVREIDEARLRGAIGVALQEPVLFSGPIRDNIRYGRPDATEAEVEAAAHAAQAHEFICGFPEGYGTVVGQRGVNLSGGQKQRVAIARALLPDPAILILDDSTSAVDVETEALIQEALAVARAGRTCFLVAQRISTVIGADRIIVLEDGRIAAQGSHTDLLASSGIYREIYESQMGGAPND